MRNYFIAPLFFLSVNALAANTFDAKTNMLNLEAVVVNGVQYNDVAVRLNAYEVVSVGSNNNAGTVADTCSSANFTVPKFNAITIGMTLDQVNQTIGCKYDSSRTAASGDFVAYSWSISRTEVTSMQVFFDSATNVVTNIMGNSFKARVGF
ncbi:MAG: hypothetical protein ABL903_02270 [Methylococcales bacterium]